MWGSSLSVENIKILKKQIRKGYYSLLRARMLKDLFLSILEVNNIIRGFLHVGIYFQRKGRVFQAENE